MGMTGARSHIQTFSASAVPVVYREEVVIQALGTLDTEIVTSSGLPFFNVWVSVDFGVQVTPQFALGNVNQAIPVPNWQAVQLAYLVPGANVPNLATFKAVSARYRVRFDNLLAAPITLSYWLSASIS